MWKCCSVKRNRAWWSWSSVFHRGRASGRKTRRRFIVIKLALYRAPTTIDNVLLAPLWLAWCLHLFYWAISVAVKLGPDFLHINIRQDCVAYPFFHRHFPRLPHKFADSYHTGDTHAAYQYDKYAANVGEAELVGRGAGLWCFVLQTWWWKTSGRKKWRRKKLKFAVFPFHRKFVQALGLIFLIYFSLPLQQHYQSASN